MSALWFEVATVVGHKVPSRDPLVRGMGCEGYGSERRPNLDGPVCSDIAV